MLNHHLPDFKSGTVELEQVDKWFHSLSIAATSCWYTAERESETNLGNGAICWPSHVVVPCQAESMIWSFAAGEHIVSGMDDLAKANGAALRSLAETVMPFGRYKGRPILDLPERYLLWFSQEGFPAGNLGRMMALALEIKVNGLEGLVYDALGRKRRDPGARP